MSDIRRIIRNVALLFAVCAVGPCIAATSALDVSGIDTSIKPGDDFYTYANGPWLKNTALPAGQAKYDTTAALREQNAARVRTLLEDAVNAPAGSLARKIGDYYASRRDTAAIEAAGSAPLSGELAEIAAIHDRDALSAYLGRTLYLDDGTNTQTEGILGVWIHQGFHDSDRPVPHILQGGLGLPDRSDYLDPAPDKVASRETYRAHIAAILKAAGLLDADRRAAHILALEIAIAKTHASADDTADVFKTDNTWRRADFEAKAPGLNWHAYFTAAGLDGQGAFVVWQPSAVIGTSALVASEPLDVWKDYLVFHRIAHYASALPKAFGAERDGDGTQQAIAATSTAFGDGIGQLYAQRYFPPENKAAAVAMVENIRAAYRTRIANLVWMSADTKQKALTKLAALNVGLGYPDTWIDYSDIAVVRGDAIGNLRRAEAFSYARALATLSQSVDPNAWAFFQPQVPGAVIYFAPNTIQFTAGILQSPYFDASSDAASNYGSAGAGIAHEISHSFDELGNIYDAHGNLGQWWTADDLAKYRAAVAPLAAQFSAYCPEPGACVNGKQVSSEVVADLTGLLVAHDAYLLSLKDHADAVKNGLTGEQRFFVAFAKRWRRVQTDASLKQQLAVDTHPPGAYRADTVRNVDAWYKAFNIKPADKLYLAPKDRVRVW